MVVVAGGDRLLFLLLWFFFIYFFSPIVSHVCHSGGYGWWSGGGVGCGWLLKALFYTNLDP